MRARRTRKKIAKFCCAVNYCGNEAKLKVLMNMARIKPHNFDVAKRKGIFNEFDTYKINDSLMGGLKTFETKENRDVIKMRCDCE